MESGHSLSLVVLHHNGLLVCRGRAVCVGVLVCFCVYMLVVVLMLLVPHCLATGIRNGQSVVVADGGHRPIGAVILLALHRRHSLLIWRRVLRIWEQTEGLEQLWVVWLQASYARETYRRLNVRIIRR